MQLHLHPSCLSSQTVVSLEEFSQVVAEMEHFIREVLPERITQVLENAIPELGKKLKGFDSYDAVLTAPETRSSSPVRIIRGKDLSSDLQGLYPCGEGAGYAGGISSAAVDGMRCAEALIKKYREE